MNHLSKISVRSGSQMRSAFSFLRAVLVVCLIFGGLPSVGAGRSAAAPVFGSLNQDPASSGSSLPHSLQPATTFFVPGQPDPYLAPP